MDDAMEMVKEAMADRALGEEVGWILTDDLDALARLENELSEIIAAASDARLNVRNKIGEVLDNKSYRYGDYIYRHRPVVKWKPKDVQGLWEFIGDEKDKVVRLDPGNLRKTALKAVAARKNIGIDAVYDTFFERQELPNRLQKLPLDRATKREQALEEGQTG